MSQPPAAFLRSIGIALFLPVPLVLWLFTRNPLGPGTSVLIGTAIMLSHRIYARPFARRYAEVRCLWCGGPSGGDGPPLEVAEPPGTTGWRACSARHRSRALNLLSWGSRHALGLKIGIGGTLVIFLPAMLAHSSGFLPLPAGDLSAFFRLAIAVTVLPLGWIGPGAPAVPGTPRVPFPVHIQALIGSWAVVWLFRIVGLVWLGQALWYAAERIGLA